MLIGLDVGGTFTDAVLLERGKVVKKVKTPTRPEALLDSLLGALDPLLEEARGKEMERISLSTTLITNLIATGAVDPVALVLIPGPGLNPEGYNFKVPDTFILSGAIDYRGREIDPLQDKEIEECIKSIDERGIKRVAVVGKFSQRNRRHEERVAEMLRKELPGLQIVLGHQVTGRLNFPRRVVTALLTLATRERFRDFYGEVEGALNARGIEAPLYILKADGGTLPFKESFDKPVETIFSGPAASILGVLALTKPGETSVVLDIGGTTTDLGLILSGNPLLASKGARVNDQLTHVRAFATKSLALGGDSQVVIEEGKIRILPRRAGAAYCLGGPAPTPTDAMRLRGLTGIGDLEKARSALGLLGQELSCSPEQVADQVLEQMVGRISAEIDQMFLSWSEEPAYRIWELHQRVKIRPQNVVGIGAASASILPLLAQKMDCHPINPPHAEVANAIGAALARVNLRLSFHFDTERNFYFIEENGAQGKLPDPRLTAQAAEEYCLKQLKEQGNLLGIDQRQEPEVLYSEVFNMVRGWRTTGRLYDICVQFPAGIMEDWLEGMIVREP